MEKKEHLKKTNPYKAILNYWKPVENGLVVAGNYALIAALILMAIWLLGRVMEALNSNTVFDSVLTFWVSISVFLLLGIKIIGFVIWSLKKITKAERRWAIVLSWIFFIIIFSLVLSDFEGFRISSSGLFAAISNSVEDTKQASFLMFKYHPANPMLALNLLVSKLKGISDIESLVSYTLNISYVFTFFIWSFVYSILLLLHKRKFGPKIVHMFFSTTCLAVIILLKSLNNMTSGQLVFLHAIALVLLIFQALLTYSVFREFAGHCEETADESKSESHIYGEGEPEKDKVLQPGLPPSALSIILCLFIILPVLADMQHQFTLASFSEEIMTDIRNHSARDDSLNRVVVTRTSIYAGPSVGDEILGFLPEGISVPVVDEKFGWINIGKNRWISEKFLRPVAAQKISPK